MRRKRQKPLTPDDIDEQIWLPGGHNYTTQFLPQKATSNRPWDKTGAIDGDEMILSARKTKAQG